MPQAWYYERMINRIIVHSIAHQHGTKKDVTLHALLRCFLQIIWRSNEPQVSMLGVWGHCREETFLGKEKRASPRNYKDSSMPERKPQRSFSAKLTARGSHAPPCDTAT